MVASARSVSDFDVHEALDMCSEYFLKFGGHHAAAGLSMEKDKFEAFKEKFERIVSEKIQEHQKEPSITIDTEIKLMRSTENLSISIENWLLSDLII
jgi:single-stranded-DNA-specific exonuclease